MTADDKQKLFNLLKTADAWNMGYSREEFNITPEFSDDEATVTETPAPAVEPETKSGMTINELTAKIERCTRCSLARTRNNVVPGMGVEHPEVVVISDAPGEDDDKQGFPFAGKAGVLLDKMLSAIALDRKSNCYLANVVKCRPPENRNPFPDEQSACFGFLQTQIHILKPKMILCMGKIAIEKLMDQRVSVNEEHGTFYDYHGIPVMVTFNPNELLVNQDLKRPAWNDLKAFKAKLDTLK